MSFKKFDLSTVVTCVILVGWLGLNAADALVESYVVPEGLDALMLLVGTAYVTKNAVEKRNSDTTKDDNDHTNTV